MTMAENWIDAFRQKHGRAPRILHLGNVANNAYQNAKILNAAGADCDVLSADYYHIMGTPEWEDADFAAIEGSMAYPAWHKMDLGGFQRPRWFAAAPRRVAIAYLIAKRQGNTAEADRLWAQMGKIYRYFCFRENSPLKKLLLFLEKIAFGLLAWLRGLAALGRRPATQDIDTASEAPNGDTPKSPEDALMARIEADAARFFPGKAIHLAKNWDSDYTISAAALYAPLFAQYDIIQAYATDPIWCYLCGVENYTAFEHGTIRTMPYDDNDTSRLALLAYANSKAIMVTNTDCVESTLVVTEHSHTPFVCGLHGIAVEDIARRTEKLTLPKDNSARFGVPEDIPVFFCPARHDKQSDGKFIKGTDLVVQAAGVLAEEGHNFRLVLAGWGRHIDEIKAMVTNLPKLAPKVIWTPPLGKQAFSRSFLATDAILDQFIYPVFGGIAFEVLAAGHAPLISKKIEDERLSMFFGSPTPYYGCRDVEDIENALREIITSPEKARALAEKGKAWVLACHSNAKILEKNCRLYENIPL